uniref:Uncharacterized protein n=1 Tax=Triticum urartu TaxID=4572 RepID=A0A8R7V6N3_TRIUA
LTLSCDGDLAAGPPPPLLPPRSSGGCRIRGIPYPPIPLLSHLSLFTRLLVAPPMADDSGDVRRIPPSRSTARAPLAPRHPPIRLYPALKATKAHPDPPPMARVSGILSSPMAMPSSSRPMCREERLVDTLLLLEDEAAMEIPPPLLPSP